MTIDELRKKWRKGLWEMTGHARKRMGQRQVTSDEIEKVIMEGDIIEQYLDDRPYPSCLIVGEIRRGFPLYVVCALGPKVYVMTAHWMDASKWLDPKTRREKKP